MTAIKLLTIGLFVFVLALAHGLAPHARAQEEEQKGGKYSVAGLDDEREVEQFFLAFKEAVGRGDKRKVASMISYPITARRTDGRWTKIRNGSVFVRRYDAIFGPAFKRLISETRVEDLWAKSSGVATPRGEIWINGVVRNERKPDAYVIKITSINGPVPGDERPEPKS